MAKAKIDKKELVKNIKKLNNLELTDDPIETKGEPEDLAEDFIQAIEEIDDAGDIEKVKKPVIDYYESLLKQVDQKEEEDADDDPEPEEDDDPEQGGEKAEFDEDEVREKLEDMDFKEVKSFCKENGLSYKPKKSAWEDDEDEVIDEIIKAMKPSEPKESKKGKGKKKDKGIDLDKLKEELEKADDADDATEILEKYKIDFEIDEDDWDDDEDEVISDIIKAAKKGNKAAVNKKKGKGKGKGKKKDKGKSFNQSQAIILALKKVTKKKGMTQDDIVSLANEILEEKTGKPGTNILKAYVSFATQVLSGLDIFEEKKGKFYKS